MAQWKPVHLSSAAASLVAAPQRRGLLQQHSIPKRGLRGTTRRESFDHLAISPPRGGSLYWGLQSLRNFLRNVNVCVCVSLFVGWLVCPLVAWLLAWLVSMKVWLKSYDLTCSTRSGGCQVWNPKLNPSDCTGETRAVFLHYNAPKSMEGLMGNWSNYKAGINGIFLTIQVWWIWDWFKFIHLTSHLLKLIVGFFSEGYLAFLTL